MGRRTLRLTGGIKQKKLKATKSFGLPSKKGGEQFAGVGSREVRTSEIGAIKKW